jgi:hypothetical protein
MSNQVPPSFADPNRQDRNFDVPVENSKTPSSATALAGPAFGADAAGARANDFVAAADGTGDAHENASQRYCYPI